MTLSELKARVMFQTNNDVEDLGEFLPAIDGYLNQGYDKLVEIFGNTNVGVADESGDIPYPKLEKPTDTPLVPEWTHGAVADYATYLIYRNGNALKQNRGIAYLQLFNDIANRLRNGNGKKKKCYNLYEE